MKKIGIIGAGGYIGRIHVKILAQLNIKIKAAYDIQDNMGHLDSVSYKINFFNNYKLFFNYAKKNLDTIVICSPNNTHYKFICDFLKINKIVICEKPLVINSRQLNFLKKNSRKQIKKIICYFTVEISPKLI